MNHLTQKLRQGTRKLWAQKLHADRILCGLSVSDVAHWSAAMGETERVSQSSVRRYEQSGPPNLQAGLKTVRAIQTATVMKHGGIQLDLEEVLKRAPRRP